ncbi:14769_t:CDS:2, partial [Funneliformis geosporum]
YMSNDKGSLECFPIYSFLFLNEKGSSLYNAYNRSEVEDKLVIKIDQDGNHAPKFSVADDVSEVYSLPEIHKCVNGQKPLKAVIDIDASKEDVETASVKGQEEDILKGLVIATSSDPSKYNYHILYAPTLLIDHYELKALTELVYTLTGEKFGKYIDRELPGQNFNLRLIVRPQMLSEEKNNNLLKIIIGQDVLQKYAKLVLQKYSNYLRDWAIEEKEETKENFIYFNRKGSDEPEEVFECNPSIAEQIQKENKNIFSAFSIRKIKGPGFPKAFIKFPSWVKYNKLLTVTETYKKKYLRPLPNEGDIYIGSPWETGKIYILEHLTISDVVNLLALSTYHSYSNAVTTRLNLKSYCNIDGNINLPDHKRIVCQIESLHWITNNCKCSKKCKCSPIQYDLWLDEIARRIIVMDNDLTDLNIEWIKALRKDKLFSIIHNTYQPQKGKKDVQEIVRTLKTDFSELRIKEYYGKSDPKEKAQQRSFNVPITKKGLFQWLLNDKRECLLQELQNRGIFPDIDSIIRNKDRMVNFLQKAGMVVSIIEFISKPEDTTILLSQTVKTAELLENKPKKTLEEMRSLDRYHIMDCYGISSELLTEDFISKYGNYNHMKWFRAYRQL